MLKYIAIMILVMFAGSVIQHAYGDWIDYMPWKLDSNEVLGVCIYEPEEDVLNDNKDYMVQAAFEAVIEWKDKLAIYSDNNEYDMKFYYILRDTYIDKTQTDFGYCNVHIMFWENIIDDESVNETAIGVTWSKGTVNGVDMVMIEVYPKVTKYIKVLEHGASYTAEEIKQNAIKIEDMIPPVGVKSIVLHEFGHAIGLGHVCNELYGTSINSLMIPYFDPFTQQLEITEHDLAAIYYKYGEDGWNGKPEINPFRYGDISEMFKADVKCT